MSKAKEYLCNNIHTEEYDEWVGNINLVEIDTAEVAVDIAIDETKEKSLDALYEVLSGRVDSDSRYYITESFKRLLNQE